MKPGKLNLAITLWLLGMIGVVVLNLTANLDAIKDLPEDVSPMILRIAGMAQGGILVLITVILGVFLAPKAGLKSLFSVPFGDWRKEDPKWLRGLVWGLGLGVALILLDMATRAMVPATALTPSSEMIESSWQSILVRLTYGGITEEVMVRFGLMSFLAWLIGKAVKAEQAYMWGAIIVSAFLFGAGHLPAVFQLFDEPTSAFIIRTVALNMLGGIVFGYLYWKHYLETAMIAHAGSHIGMILTGLFLSLV